MLFSPQNSTIVTLYFYGLPPKFLIAKLQPVQNSVGRLVYKTRNFDHITPALLELHWHPIRHHIFLRFFFFPSCYGSSYLSDLLSFSIACDLLVIVTLYRAILKDSTYGYRSLQCVPL